MNPNTVVEIKAIKNKTYEDRVAIKQRGRPIPNVGLVQETTSSRGKYTRKFNAKYYDTYKWLCGCEETNAVYCFPCLIFSATSIWATDGFKNLCKIAESCSKHAISKDHINYSSDYANLGKDFIVRSVDSAYHEAIARHNRKVEQNRYIVQQILKCIVLCGKLEISLRGHDESSESENRGNFMELLKYKAEDSAVLAAHLETVGRGKASYLTSSSQNELLDCCYEVYQATIMKEIHQANYVCVMADETTDVATTTQLVIIYRYVIGTEVKERFWGFFKPESVDAAGISSILLEELDKVMPKNVAKLIGQTYDGAAVMRGVHNGVHVRVKEKYPHAHYVHCFAHQLNLILKNSAKDKESAKFFKHLHAISNYFQRSSQKTDIFFKIAHKRIPTSSPTRWNFNSRIILTVKMFYDELTQCFQKINETINDNSLINATFLLKAMESDKFKFWLSFYNDIYTHVDILFAQVQSTTLDLSKAQKDIEIFKCQLNNIKDNHGNTEIENRNREVNNVISALLNDITSRLKFDGHLIGVRLFDTNLFPEYEKVFPMAALKAFVDYYPFFILRVLQAELAVLYTRADCRELSTISKILRFIIDNDLIDVFQETFKALNLLLAIPLTSVSAEQDFSALKRIKTDKRATMTESRINALTAISCNPGFFENPINVEHIIDMFAHKKTRKMDLIKK